MKCAVYEMIFTDLRFKRNISTSPKETEPNCFDEYVRFKCNTISTCRSSLSLWTEWVRERESDMEKERKLKNYWPSRTSARKRAKNWKHKTEARIIELLTACRFWLQFVNKMSGAWIEVFGTSWNWQTKTRKNFGATIGGREGEKWWTRAVIQIFGRIRNVQCQWVSVCGCCGARKLCLLAFTLLTFMLKTVRANISFRKMALSLTFWAIDPRANKWDGQDRVDSRILYKHKQTHTHTRTKTLLNFEWKPNNE